MPSLFFTLPATHCPPLFRHVVDAIKDAATMPRVA